MSIVPDVKDWTWVITARCGECGVDPRQFVPEEYGAVLRETAARWTALLADSDYTALGRRPDPQTWAPLEYACHVRDVIRIFDLRLRLLLETADPTFPNWDQDATAVEGDYLAQDPVVVSVEIPAAAVTLADRFDGVAGDQWERTGTRSDAARFTVEGLGRYFLHDVLHHLWDVRAAVAPRP